MKPTLIALASLIAMTAMAQNPQMNMKAEELKITQEWDKVFAQSTKVDHEKVTFVNMYGITLVADLYKPKGVDGPFAALAVSGPFGAVKEQSSGLYAQTMAEKGFLTIAFDPSFTGESGGQPRRVASSDINTEDFMAAVDYLATRSDVDTDKIGIIGICGWGGIALNAAAIDTRIKATAAITMYDMTRVAGNGYYDSGNSEEVRHAMREEVSKQRIAEYKRVLAMGQATDDNAEGAYKRAGGVVDPLPEGAPKFVKDYHAYYKTPRGYHARSGNSNDGWNATGQMAYLNARFLHYTNEIRSAVLVMHGEEAHSRYFGEDAFKNMMNGNPVPDNKELLIVSGATHCDLYDGGDKHFIPWEKLADFFEINLK